MKKNIRIIGVIFGVIALLSVLPVRGEISDAQAITFVKNTWQITDLSDDVLTQTLSTPYSGIPYKQWIDFLFNAPEFLVPLANGDYSTAASKAYGYAQDTAFAEAISEAGLTGVAAPAELAVWPIDYALTSFYQTVVDDAFKGQCKLYFQARAYNSASAILNLAPGNLLDGVDITKNDQGYLFSETGLPVGQIPGFSGPAQFFAYAETLWQANNSAAFDSASVQLAAQFRQAAAPGAPPFRWICGARPSMMAKQLRLPYKLLVLALSRTSGISTVFF